MVNSVKVGDRNSSVNERQQKLNDIKEKDNEIYEKAMELSYKFINMKSDLREKSNKILSKERKIDSIEKAKRSPFKYSLISIAKIFAGVFGIALFIPFTLIGVLFTLYANREQVSQIYGAIGRTYEKLGVFVGNNGNLLNYTISRKKTLDEKELKYKQELAVNNQEFELLKKTFDEKNSELLALQEELNECYKSYRKLKEQHEDMKYHYFYFDSKNPLERYEKERKKCEKVFKDREKKVRTLRFNNFDNSYLEYYDYKKRKKNATT